MKCNISAFPVGSSGSRLGAFFLLLPSAATFRLRGKIAAGISCEFMPTGILRGHTGRCPVTPPNPF